MKFDLKAQGRKSTRDGTLIKLPKSPSLRVSATGTSNAIFLTSNGDEICHRITLLLQEKHARKNSIKINDEINALVDKFLENKCMSKKKHKQILIKCNLLHT